jgi:putative hydrolase of the HAD superfamily
MALSTVVFDVGGVLSAAPFDALEEYAAGLGLAPGALPAYFIDDPDFARVEAGQLTMRDFLSALVARVEDAHQVVLDPRSVVECLRRARQLRPEMLALAEELSVNHLVGVLTNNVRENDEWLTAQLPPAVFRTVVNSALAGVRKPDPAAYVHLLEKLDRTGEEIVYIDDFAVNLPPAAALGMHTILFTSTVQCRDQLVTLGLLPD